MAVRLVDKGHQIFLITSNRHIVNTDSSFEKIPGEVIYIEMPRAFNFFRHWQASKLIKRACQRISPDIVNVHFSAAIFTYGLSNANSSLPSIGMVHGVLHNSLKPSLRTSILKIAEWWVYSRMSVIEVLTQEDRSVLQNLNPRINVRLVPGFGLGCDLNIFNTSLKHKVGVELRNKFEIPGESIVFGYSGRQVVYKGFGKVVRAFHELAQKHSNIYLVIVGEKDNIHPTGLKPSEESFLNHERIRRFPWQQEPKGIASLMSMVDWNVFPSEREGMPVNIMECLAMGIPTITSNVRGCRNIVSHEKNGLILKRRDDLHLKKAMERVISDKHLSKTLGAECVKMRNQFDRNLFIEDQIAFFFEKVTNESN